MKKFISVILIFAVTGCYSNITIRNNEKIPDSQSGRLISITTKDTVYVFNKNEEYLNRIIPAGVIVSDSTGEKIIPHGDIISYKFEKFNQGKTLLATLGIIGGTVIIVGLVSLINTFKHLKIQ